MFLKMGKIEDADFHVGAISDEVECKIVKDGLAVCVVGNEEVIGRGLTNGEAISNALRRISPELDKCSVITQVRDSTIKARRCRPEQMDWIKKGWKRDWGELDPVHIQQIAKTHEERGFRLNPILEDLFKHGWSAAKSYNGRRIHLDMLASKGKIKIVPHDEIDPNIKPLNHWPGVTEKPRYGKEALNKYEELLPASTVEEKLEKLLG